MTKYTVLFEVNILHDYLLSRGDTVYESLNVEQQKQIKEQYDSNGFLNVFPTEKTRRSLAGYRMIFKATTTGCLVAVETLDSPASDLRPAIPLSSDFHLSFALCIKDARFFNYTALSDRSSSLYYFSNDSGNETARSRFLSVPVPTFEPSRAYKADEFYGEVSSGVINLFRALRDTGPSATPLATDWVRIPPDTFDNSASYTKGAIVLMANRLYRALKDGPSNDLNDTNEWEMYATLANQYVTATDSIVTRPPLFNLDVSSAALPQVTVRLTSPGGSDIVWEKTFVAESSNLESIQVDARGLKPGSYELFVFNAALTELPALGFRLYMDATAVRDNWFGVVDISLGTGNLALLDGSGVLRSPRYTIRFLNRATRWRYIFPKNQSVGTGAEVSPESGDNRTLVTDRPRALSRFGKGVMLQTDVAGTPISEVVLLPIPETTRIRRQNAQWYSEIHMSNLTL